MANTTVYPYGTNGSLPSSIGIINDLITGGADKALSAQQGVNLKELIGETSITGAGTTVVATTMYCTLLAGHTYRLHIKYPTVDYTGISYNTSGYRRFSASVVKKDTTTEQIVYLGFDATTALAPYYDFSVPDDAECVGINIQMRAASGFLEYFKLEDITLSSILEEGVDELNTKVLAFENALTVVETSYTQSMMYGTDMYISNGVWKKSSNGTNAAAYLPVTKGWKVRMTAKNSQPAYCYFVDSIGSVNDPCSAERHLAAAGTTIEITVEEDCLLWVAAYLTPDYFPANLTIVKYVLGDGEDEAVIERYAVNLCNADMMKNGTLDNNGDITTGSGLVTDFMPTKVGTERHRYQKTQFVLACSSVFLSSTFAFGAVKVCLYDSTKTYIGAISDVSTYIDKESDANADLFSTAHYMRVQFAAGTSDHYVALSNKPVLPQYTPYNKENFIASKNVIYDKYHNSDGAISNMLETSLDYINNCLALGLGYGDSATAHDLLVEPVTPDPWSPNAYEGEKKQINCSTFVQLCLEGVRYKNSRYVSGSSGLNYGNGYVFDENTETNYHNPREEQQTQYENPRFIPCSTHNKLYANMLLKYAYMRGFAYLIEGGFKNVEVGDVIFQCSSDTNTFKGSPHVLFVSAVSLNQDGTKTISIMQDGGSGEATETNNLTSKSSSWVYAARFPLPNVTSKATNIVSSLEKHNFTQLSSGSTFVIGTLSLTENIKPKGVYTAVIKCSAVGDFEIMVGSTNEGYFNALGTNGETLFRRGDGVTVKHFHLPINSNINTDTLAIVIKAYSNLSSNVEVVDAKVYDGYVTE